MSEVRAVHPGTGGEALVDEEAMFHLRQSGWLLASEHEANQAAAAEAEAKSAKGSKSEDK
jgi:hypothetical protein